MAKKLSCLLVLISICSVVSCNFSERKRQSQSPDNNDLELSDTLSIASRVEIADEVYRAIEKSLYDSVRRVQSDNVDFSTITHGIQRKYESCKNDFLKSILAIELSKNYYLCYRNNRQIVDNLYHSKQLFLEFLNFQGGAVAVSYFRIEPLKIQYLTENWDNFSTEDHENILFYALLKGFENGLPEILQDK